MSGWGVPQPTMTESQHLQQSKRILGAEGQIYVLALRLDAIESRTPWDWLKHFWRQLWTIHDS
jgi:hypothetical protein